MRSHNTLGFLGLNKLKIDLRIAYCRYDKVQILIVARSDVSKVAEQRTKTGLYTLRHLLAKSDQQLTP